MLVYNYENKKVNGNVQIHTTGCELSIYDACKFASTLDPNKKAIVFNTCSFVADRELENKMLTRLLKKAYPNHTLYILGCDVNYHRDTFEGVGDIILSNEEVKKIVDTVDPKDTVAGENELDPCIYIKIQDGCHHKCTYCIINQLRSNPYSVPYDTIVKDVKAQMEKKGCDKIALAGTELTAYYDAEKGYHLSDMLEHLIQDVPGIRRIIMNAFDPAPKETERMIRFIANHRDLFIPHVILAAQSGSDTILKAMKRRHTVERLRELHRIADEVGVSLGWDTIVGFPGETEELFMETYHLMEELHPFSQTLFTYSKREGTPAATFPDQVPEEVKADRLRRIYALKYENAKKFPEHFSKYIEYTEEDNLYNQCATNKRNALEIMADEEGVEFYLDMLNEDMVAQIILDPPKNTVIHVNFDTDREAECGIMLNFLEHNLKSIPIVVHVPKDFKDDVSLFEKQYQCIVRRDN